jgi:hypothetical protein
LNVQDELLEELSLDLQLFAGVRLLHAMGFMILVVFGFLAACVYVMINFRGSDRVIRAVHISQTTLQPRRRSLLRINVLSPQLPIPDLNTYCKCS